MDQVFKAKNNDYVVTWYQSTADITGAIIKAIKESLPASQKLAPYFKNKDKKTTAKLIFMFAKNLRPYKKEPSSFQTARTMQRILSDNNKGIDCKHYSILVSSLCLSLGIKCRLRLITQINGSNTPNHIYAVAIINGNEVIIDQVLKNFDQEANYISSYDINLN
jgi:hypothetical protein